MVIRIARELGVTPRRVEEEMSVTECLEVLMQATDDATEERQAIEKARLEAERKQQQGRKPAGIALRRAR